MEFDLLFAFLNRERLPGVVFVLFLLCDMVIGLQVAAGGYLLSRVLIALQTKK